jgi:hypothetical protein
MFLQQNDSSGGLLFMWGVLPSFQSYVSIATSQNPSFDTSKIEKTLFVGRNKN